MPSRSDEKIKVFYDGKCPMCSSLVETIRRSGKGPAFDLRDMHGQKSLPFERGQIEKSIHLIDLAGATHKGPAAILEIIEQYPQLKFLARAGRFPLVYPVLPVGYRLVAVNRRFLFGPAARIFWLKTSIMLAFLIGLALSPRLWIGPRSFPPTPILAGLPAWPPALSHVLFGGLFVLGLSAIALPRPRWSIGAFLLIIAAFCAFDQTRWQPWIFLYVVMLTTLLLFSWNSQDEAGRRYALNVARLIIATTYVFSGLQKINSNFFDYEFPWIVSPITNVAPVLKSPLYFLGMAVPFIQVAFGIGLLTRRYRRAALAVAVSMHVFILAMFGPFGLDWNNTVWPWTAVMAVFDIILFATKEDFDFRDIFMPAGKPYHVLFLALLVVAPLLSFFNLWDSYLSAALYSGNLTEGQIYASDAGAAALPGALRHWFVHTSTNTNVLNIQRWAVEELNAMPYPETRIYKRIAKDLCHQAGEPSQIVLIVREQRMFRSAPETGYRCGDL